MGLFLYRECRIVYTSVFKVVLLRFLHFNNEFFTLFILTVYVKNELTNLLKAKEFLSTRVSNTVYDLFSFLQDEQTILIEGAQATLLDIDHGTYPFVTSSGTTVTGALKSLGLPPQLITSCIGVAKAYCTRVGAGVFHTEVDGETADRLRERGGEYGSTTGRPRRCGWMDTSDLHYAALINGFTHLNITKLDVLDEEETVPVRIGEDEKGKSMFEDLPGWKTSTEGITDFDKLPEEAQDFMDFIEEQTGVPVSLIGTGQKREEMIIRN